MNSKLLSGKTILVTGGAGAIGSVLVQNLSRLCRLVIILDNFFSAYTWNVFKSHNVICIRGDIRNIEDLKKAFNYEPEIVIHLAAFFANQRSVDFAVENESVNGFGLVQLLEFSVNAKSVKRFIYSNSEGGAYGSDSVVPYSESDISVQLSTPYYVTKLAGEAYCNYYSNQYGLEMVTLRLFNSFGPGEVPGSYRNVIPNFIYWAMQGKSLPLTGDKEMARDFVYVQDIAQAFVRACVVKEAVGLAINIATGTPTRIYDLARKINEITGNVAGTHILESRIWDTRKAFYGENDLCLKILGFKPESRIEEGLFETQKWFHSNWKNIMKSAKFS